MALSVTGRDPPLPVNATRCACSSSVTRSRSAGDNLPSGDRFINARSSATIFSYSANAAASQMSPSVLGKIVPYQAGTVGGSSGAAAGSLTVIDKSTTRTDLSAIAFGGLAAVNTVHGCDTS